jgi:hypothetical protein
MLGDQPLQPHQAGVPKQIRADLALLERARWIPSTRRAPGSAQICRNTAPQDRGYSAYFDGGQFAIVGGSRARALIYIKRLVEGGLRLL